MKDINSTFAQMRAEASRELKDKGLEMELARAKEARENEVKSRRNDLLVGQILEVHKALTAKVDELFKIPSDFSAFVDGLAKSTKHIDLYEHLFDIAPIRHIGELPRRVSKDKSVLALGLKKAVFYDVADFKVSYSLINLTSFESGAGYKGFTLALAVAMHTHLVDRAHGFEIDIPKYEVVCYRIDRLNGGSLDTVLDDFRKPIDGLYWALKLYSLHEQEELMKAVVMNYPEFKMEGT